jgi:hypothetical protein
MIRYNEWLNDSCVDLSLRLLKQEGLSVTVVASTILVVPEADVGRIILDGCQKKNG